MAYYNGNWQSTPTYAQAVDFATDGTAIGRSQGSMTAPVLLNGKWEDISKYAPDIDAAWKSGTSLIDTTAGGWILARGGGYATNDYSVMLPIKVQGISPSEASAGATGVDEFSISCENPGPDVQNRIWIMAPLSEGQTHFTLEAPLSDATPLNLKIGSQEVRFDGATEKILASKHNDILIEGISTNGSTHDVALELTLGTAECASKPLGVKLMKHRIVRVKPLLITKRTVTESPPHSGNHIVETNPPDLYPSRLELENYLNEVFEPQINATFVVAEPTELQLEWDANHNGSADPESAETPGPELQPMLDLADGYVDNADIKIFFLGTEKKIFFGDARGFTISNSNSCWVVADTLANPQMPGSGFNVYEVMQTVAHEIGHVMLDAGHPDRGEGPAPLPGTNHLERLMVNGSRLPELKVGNVSRAIPRKHRLVKGEWDKVDEWLASHVDRR